MASNYLDSARKQFLYYKSLGEKTFAQVPDEALFWQYNGESNSIALIVQHLWGNMLSRWTDFLTSDGEKEWRQRDAEFEPVLRSRQAVMEKWDEGWACFLAALNGLTEEDLNRTVYIRSEPHSVVEAINRQLAHYPYHVGQIVFLGKMACDAAWSSLSIPKGGSRAFNDGKIGSQASPYSSTGLSVK